ncbi:MAG TPA: hypothetical protein VHE54_14770 [Puia sp.]|nr:hypothetical protein [Puia sp.]
MQWWPFYGLKRQLAESREFASPVPPMRAVPRIFRHSLFIYVIDVGSSNALNFEISALESPQYSIHRYGIYLTDSPRHADILLVLGKPTAAMLPPLLETVSQLPEPFCIATIDDCPEDRERSYPDLPNHICALEGIPSPAQILGMLLDLSTPKRKTR